MRRATWRTCPASAPGDTPTAAATSSTARTGRWAGRLATNKHLKTVQNTKILSLLSKNTLNLSSEQVYLVTGGAPYPYTASTEVLVEGDSAWREAGPLPSARYGLRVASLGSSLLATGGVQDARRLFQYVPWQEGTMATTTWTLCSCWTPPP